MVHRDSLLVKRNLVLEHRRSRHAFVARDSSCIMVNILYFRRRRARARAPAVSNFPPSRVYPVRRNTLEPAARARCSRVRSYISARATVKEDFGNFPRISAFLPRAFESPGGMRESGQVAGRDYRLSTVDYRLDLHDIASSVSKGAAARSAAIWRWAGQ